jgi:hypothetical protein
VRGQHEVEAAGLAGQTEVKLGVLVWVCHLNVLELVIVVIREILLERASNVIRLLIILLTVIGRTFNSTNTAVTLCLSRH